MSKAQREAGDNWHWGKKLGYIRLVSWWCWFRWSFT